MSQDKINHPKHYTSHPSGVECIQITEHYNFCVGNAIKYAWRCGLKQEEGMDPIEKQIEDLGKAVWYLNKEINNLKEGVYNGKSVAQKRSEGEQKSYEYGKNNASIHKCCSGSKSRNSCHQRSTQDGSEYCKGGTTGFYSIHFRGTPTMTFDSKVNSNYNMKHGTQWNGVSASGWEIYFGKESNATV